MDNVERIASALRNGEYTSSPHECARDLAVLAGEYSYALGRWEAILQRKPAMWSEMRKSFKSDTSCERAWEATSDGMAESGLRLRSRSIERMMSALKSLIRIAESESRNLM